MQGRGGEGKGRVGVGEGVGGLGWGGVPLVQLRMLSHKWLQRYRLLENTEILLLQDVLDFNI